MTIATLWCLAWLATSSVRTCTMGEPILREGAQVCVCNGPLYVDRTARIRCGGFCHDGFAVTSETPDGLPVCTRKDTTDDQLRRIEQKLDTLLQQKGDVP
jgi:hypothetical protein